MESADPALIELYNDWHRCVLFALANLL